MTLRLMRDLANDGKKSLPVREFAAELVRGLDQKDWKGQVERLHAFVRDGVAYLRDIHDVETLQTPDVTLERRYGDCDDKATLLAALLESIGHPARFVAVGFQPGRFSHVYTETKLGTKWVAAETTEPKPLGWFPPGITTRMVQDVS